MLRKIYIVIVCCFLLKSTILAQSITNYSFTRSAGTFTAITGTNPTATGTASDGYFNNIPIGFDFYYMGVKYTSVSASVKGWLTFGANITASTGTNSLASGGARPLIAPLWDDLDMILTTNGTYTTTGTAGSRVFTWQSLYNRWCYTVLGSAISYQVKLYEGTGKIEFIYRSELGLLSAPSCSIGIAAAATGSGNFLSLNGTGTNPAASSTTETTSLAFTPANGQTYAFSSPLPAAPSSLTINGVTGTGMTLNWADNSGNETGFAIYQSTDGTNYTYVTKTVANATSQAVTGLTTGSTYYWRVYAVSEGNMSTAASGSQLACGSASASIAYSGTPFCTTVSSANVSFTGTTGGTFSSTTGLIINATTGAINPSTSTAGTYTVTYTIPAVGGCSQYTTTTSIVIKAMPAATIAYAASPFCSNGGVASVNLTGTSGGTFTSSPAGLSINGSTGQVTPTSSSVNNYTVTYTVAAGGGCAQFQTTANVKVVSPGTWTGSTSTDWNTAGNWLCGAIPTATMDAVIPTGLSTYPVISSSASVKNITIQNSASLTVTGTLNIAGSITSTGTLTASAGTIHFNGSTAQTIPANAFAGNSIANLTIDNNVSLAGALKITGTFNIASAGKTFTTNNYLTLASSAAGTATVAPLPVNGSNVATSFISGKVAVERYIPSRRAWRLLTSPLSQTGSIYSNWQNNGVYQVGQGILITGPSPAALNGLDASTTNTISMKGYDVSAQNFLNISNTKTSDLSNTTGSADNTGFFVFVRGDRNPLNLLSSNSNNTTLTSTGYLQTGKQVFPASSTINQYTLIGNPYASPVDFNNVQRTKVMKRFYAWDPHLNSVGGYVMLDDLDGDGTFSKSIPSSSQDKNIQSGQAVFVQTATSGAANVTFTESSKSTTVHNAGFRPAGGFSPASFSALLMLRNPDTTIVADGLVAEFDDSFSDSVDMVDAIKFNNINETFGLMRSNVFLALERRRRITDTDTLYLKLTKTAVRNYRFVFDMSAFNAPGLIAYLVDVYTGTTSVLNTEGSATVDFAVTADAASTGAGRFKVIFKQATVLPVTFTKLIAKPSGKDVLVGWSVANEVNVSSYTIEGSPDGITYKSLGTVQAAGNNEYEWLDRSVAAGKHFYRIKSIDNNGKAAYSNIAKVVTGKTSIDNMVVYPNPVTNSVINIQMNGVAAGKYTMRLYAQSGEKVFEKNMTYTGESVYTLPPGKQLAKGVYQLEVSSAATGTKTTLSVLVQ